MQWLIAAACCIGIIWQRKHLDVGAIASAWLVAAAGSVFVGLIQYFGFSATFGPWVYATAAGDAVSNLGQRNHFATLTSIGLLSAIWCAHRMDQRAMATRIPWLILAAVVLLAIGNAVTKSRTGMLQWGAILSLALVWWGPKSRLTKIAFFGVCIYAVSLVLFPWLLSMATGVYEGNVLTRFSGSENHCASRIHLWANVIHLISQKPLTGWGWGELGFAHFVTDYPMVRYCDAIENAHNLPLQIAVELGVPAAIILCFTVAWLVINGRPLREENLARQLAWGVLFVVAIHSMVEYPLWYGYYQIAVGLCIWMLCKSAQPTGSGVASTRGLVGKSADSLLLHLNRHSAFLGTIAVAAVIFAMSDYLRVSTYVSSRPGAPVSTWLFVDEAQYFQLQDTDVTPDNALQVSGMALETLHFQQTPMVVEKLIASYRLLGNSDKADFFAGKYELAFGAALPGVIGKAESLAVAHCCR